MSTPTASTHLDTDPDRTAELPVLDPMAYAAAERQKSRTDTWVTPPPVPRAAEPPAARAAETSAAKSAEVRKPERPEPAAPPAAKLSDTQGVSGARSERLAQAERARDEAQAGFAASEERATQLRRELEQLRAEHTFQQDEHERTRAHFEEELAQARTLVSTASERAEELRRQLGELENAARTQRSQQERHQQQTAKERAHAAGAMEDLHLERSRSLSFYESLQSAEGRRTILESVLTDLHREAAEREADVAGLARDLLGRDAHARELEGELTQRAARITRLEQQVTSFAAALAQRDTQLRESRNELQALTDSLAALRTQLAAANERLRVLHDQAQAHSNADSQQQSEFGRMAAERAGLTAAVESARAAAVAATSQAAAHEAALAQVRTRNAELESALIAERRRVGQLEDELAAVRREMQDWDQALKAAQQERNAHLATIAGAEVRAKELEERAAEQLEAVRVLQADTNASVARTRELEGDLRAAEDTVHRLESEARTRSARMEELEKANLQWRSALEDARQATTDNAANQELREAAAALAAPEAAAPAAPERPHPEPAPEGAVRLLIHNGDGREVMHVLGRKTSVGRTPDNDLQIDTKFVSRHHAVILAGPVHTIIEDLNSTNGVQVNGRRVTRHVLKDGDTVLIGRSQYRFALRKGSDKR